MISDNSYKSYHPNFEQIAEQLLNKLKDKGGQWKNKILDFIDRVIEDREEKRSIKDVYEKIKNYFKDLQIDLREKFVKFGEWAKQKYEEGLEKSKDRAQNLRELAKKVSTFYYIKITSIYYCKLEHASLLFRLR